MPLPDKTQALTEARRIARENGLRIAACPAGEGKTDYVVYREIQGGNSQRLGKRSDPDDLRRYVSKLATTH